MINKKKYFKSEVYAVINSGYYERLLVFVPSSSGGYLQFFDYLDKSDNKLPVLINTIIPDRPDSWIYKKTDAVHEILSPYHNLLSSDVLFFEYAGFPWLWEDADTLTHLLNGRPVAIQDSIFEGNLYSDILHSNWRYVESQNDADIFLKEVYRFHDTVIKELHYTSGAYVDNNKSMFPVEDKRSVLVQIQSQQCQNFEMEFQAVTALNLRPASDNYMGDIFDATLIVHNKSIFFCDQFLENMDTSYSGTWITAYSLRWRFTEQIF